ncbi:hypothetical protein [Rhodococcus qingshengii]|uniref:hypothetical protein n=1 Tax=Rhodococcus qingshengii TaxID=334542 RepID=UPI0035D5B809
MAEIFQKEELFTMENVRTMNGVDVDLVRKAIEDVLNYMWEDEKNDFQINGGEDGNHIFSQLVVLKKAVGTS